jgi:hypothetical protein
MIYRGGCHCGTVRFELEAPGYLTVDECNCSICAATGFLHVIVPKENFRLLQGKNELTTYTFNTGVAEHKFCKHCGVKSFYVPRSHPNGISVNFRCLSHVPPEGYTISPFDGTNWEENVQQLHDR